MFPNNIFIEMGGNYCQVLETINKYFWNSVNML